MEQSMLAPAVQPRRSGPRGYPALDGIRALAVIAVLLYHFGVGGVRGGFLGVDVFFVLSGYLITGQLVTRWVVGGRVDFGSFWLARARRLLPALGAMLVGTAAAVIVLDRAQLTLFRGDLSAAATYTSNWWYVFHSRSYFVASGRPPVLQHLWSLAVEEQFYLVWPLVVGGAVALCVGVRARLRVLLAAALAIGIGSSLTMGVGSALSHAPQAGDPSRWYFGTDSHVMGLMAGAALALLRRGDGLGSREGCTRLRPATPAQTALGGAALFLLLLALSRTSEFSPWLYRWGFASVSLLTVVVISVATRAGPLATGLDRPILQALGRRSYAIYLWHWPVACFTRPGIDLPIPPAEAFALRVGLTLLLAEATYRWIEQPVRRLGWRPVWRAAFGARIGSVRMSTAITLGIAALVTGMVLPASATPNEAPYDSDGTVYAAEPGHPGSVHVLTPDRTDPAHGSSTQPPGTPIQTPKDPATKDPATKDPAPKDPAPKDPVPRHHTVGSPRTTQPQPQPEPERRPPPASRAALRDYDLVVYGDSVPLGAIARLAATFHTLTNHAQIGEQSWTLLPELTDDARAGLLDGRVVLLHTGDNGVINAGQLDETLRALSHAALVVLAVPYVPRPWQDGNRATVQSAAGKYRNVALMDWADTARSHPDLVWSDGIHLTNAGKVVYASMVARAAVR